MKSRYSFLGTCADALFSNVQRTLTLSFLFSSLFMCSLTMQAQSNDSSVGEPVVLRAGEYTGHYYTPPADWILEKMNSPSTSLIGDPPCSTINVTYTGFTPAAEAAFQAAVDIWETILTGSVEITIDAYWEPLSPGILGSTGTLSERNFPGAPSTDFYAASVANQIAGYDLSPGSFDMTMSFSSNFDWYLGTDGNPAFDEYDLVTVTLHEIGHGLGFSSSKKYNSTTGVGSFSVGSTGVPKNYDRFLTSGPFGTELLDLSGTILGDALTGNNVYNNSPLAVAANGGVAPRMYAPASYAGGSSISHWNESTYPAGNPNSLMTPSAGAGEAIHDPGPLTIALLEDLGWVICYGDVDPCLGNFDYLDVTMPGHDQVITIAGCNLGGDYDEIMNVTNGDQYTFVSNVNSDDSPAYITVRSGTYDGPVLGEGYSPLTVTSNVNGSIFSHYSADEFCDFASLGCTSSTVQCITCPHYCEDLDMVEGDACDDGNPTSIDDVITADCICQGIQPCLNTTPFATRTFDGSNQVFSSGCTYEQEYNTFLEAENGSTYTFTSEDDGEPGFITVRSGTYDGTVLGYGYSPLTVVSDIDGALYAHYNVDGACATATGCVSITAQCITCPEYCPLLDLAVGSPCDDGNPSTINDMVTSECECYGEQPCETGSIYVTRFFDGTDIVVGGSNCNFENEYNAYENAELNNQYTFTSEDDGYPGFITIRSGTPDGNVLGYGFSPVTVISDVNGTLYAHYTVNGNCDLDDDFNCVVTTAQCITCPHYCEELGMVEGDPCDDGDPDTNYDRITEDCGCAGNLPCTADYDYYDFTMPGTNEVFSLGGCNLVGDYNIINNVFDGDQYTFVSTGSTDTPAYITVRSGSYAGPIIGEGYSPLTITSNVDGTIYTGITTNEYCEETSIGCITSTVQCITCFYDCPSIGANYGDPCDDGDPNTVQDQINGDCLCQGVVPPSNDLCDDAILINVNAPGDCPENEIVGTTSGASSDGLSIDCEESNPDVFYSFNSGPYSTVIIHTAMISATDLVINPLEGGCDGTQLLCSLAPDLELSVNPNSDYTIRISTNIGFGSTGTFGLCVEGVYDCPGLSANIGDACDDGLSETQNDMVTAECTCEGTVVFDCPDLGLNIGDACNDGDPTTIADVVTPSCDCVGESIYDCPALAGNIGDPCDDGNPNTSGDEITPACECAGTIIPDNDTCENAEGLTVYAEGECPDNQTIGTTLGAIDDFGFFSCDGGGGPHPDVFYTFNSGEYNEISLDVAILSATDIVIGIGELCGGDNITCIIGEGNSIIDVVPNTDYFIRIASNLFYGDPGTFSICLSGMYDCPILEANIGDDCDDGNSGTINDTVNAACECVGEPTSASLNGTASWNGDCGSRDIALGFFEPGTGNMVEIFNSSINAAGSFTIGDIPVGTFDIYVKIDGYLRKVFLNQSMVDGPNNLVAGSFTVGDLNGDNGVNIIDVSVVNAAFGSTSGNAGFNPLADMNCDGGVNIIDVSILNASFGMVGANPPTP